MNGKLVDWLLQSPEPWTRYKTYTDLLELDPLEADVVADKKAMLAHPLIQELIDRASLWPGSALKRHNDAKHALYAFSTLADFGVNIEDQVLNAGIQRILAHQSQQGPFQTLLHLYKRFGGVEGEHWTWMACDAPVLLYSLLAFGFGGQSSVKRALQSLVEDVEDNGWGCKASIELGNFRGPGKQDDPCPMATLSALRVLSLVPEMRNCATVSKGTEMLLRHWECQDRKKYFLFGIGTDFRKLKYPFVWYNLLFVVDVLSHFPHVHQDPRFLEIVQELTEKADPDGCYTATSMYRAWKEWSFADKKNPSPWLTFIVQRIHKRITNGV